jgi:RNA polymerase sigma factor (sigma-70 family)
VSVEPNGAVLRQVRLLYETGPLTYWGDNALLDAFACRRDASGEAAFSALVERHGPMVLRVCRAVLRDDHDAHDAFQATFLVLARRARSVRVGETLGPWLHGVAWRVAMRARAASARRRHHERRAAEMASRTVEPPVNHNAEAEALLHEEIRRLPERFRVAVVLCDLEGLTTDQAAAKLGTPVGTVRSRLSRGRDRLRSRLVRRGLAPSVVAATVTAGSASISAVVPLALAESTVRAAVVYAAAGTVPVALSWLIRGGLSAMQIKGLAALGMTLAVVAGAGGLAAQEPGKGAAPAKTEAKPKAASEPIAKSGGSPKAVVSDFDRLQGRWKLIRTTRRDGESIIALFKGFTFSGYRLTQDSGFAQETLRFLMDPKVKALFVTTDAGSAVERWSYAFEDNGERLVLGVPLNTIPPRGANDEISNVDATYELVRDDPQPAGDLGKPKAVTDLQRLIGRWRVNHTVVNGRVDDDRNGVTGFSFEKDKYHITGLPGLPRTFAYTVDSEGTAKGKRQALRVEQISPAGPDAKSGWISFYFRGDSLRLAMYEPLGGRPDPELLRPKGGPDLVEFHLVREPEPSKEPATPKISAGDPRLRETEEDYQNWRRKIETEITYLEAQVAVKKAELLRGEAEFKVKGLAPTQEILEKLEGKVALSFPNETPLEDVLKYIRTATADPGGQGIPVYVDPIGLQEAGKTLASTVSIDLEGVPLRTGLRLILKQLDLAYVVNDGLLTITSKESVDHPKGLQ